MPAPYARIVGSVSRDIHGDGPGVAYLNIDRGLKGGRLDTVHLDEAKLAEVVAEGARILATLARDRALAERARARATLARERALAERVRAARS